MLFMEVIRSEVKGNEKAARSQGSNLAGLELPLL